MGFADFVSKRVGTTQWVVARRWTPKLKEKYLVRIHPDHFKPWWTTWEQFGDKTGMPPKISRRK